MLFRSDALLNEIQRQGFQALVSEIHSEQDLAQTLRRFAQFRVSGVIVTSGQPPEALVNECVQQHIPVVGINRQPTIPGVDYVCSDNAAGAELAADQLLRSGCQRFGWLNHHPSTWAGRMRGEAFGRALQTRGVDVERHLAILACQQEGYAGGLQAAALADEALLRINPADLDALLHPGIDPDHTATPIVKGLPASPGAAVGALSFDADDAAERGAERAPAAPRCRRRGA